MSTFAISIERKGSSKTKFGAIAQLVEQRTENPCVPGSIPGGTTKKTSILEVFFVLYSAMFFVKMIPHTYILRANGNNRIEYYHE